VNHQTESLPRIFDRSNGKQWDYVFNCGGETRYSQEDEVYKVRSLALSVAAGKEAAKRDVKAFVELSTGMVYKPDSQPSKEGDKLKPWRGKCCRHVERLEFAEFGVISVAEMISSFESIRGKC
jgi:hypothetical protein